LIDETWRLYSAGRGGKQGTLAPEAVATAPGGDCHKWVKQALSGKSAIAVPPFRLPIR